MRFALAALALLMVPTMTHAQDRLDDATIQQILDDRIVRDEQSVGIATAIIENGQTRFVSSGSFGLDDPRKIDEHTIFEAGSITKLFTTLILAQLALDGSVDLDAPIVQYLPEGTVLPEYDGKQITAFDLATHSSGLPAIPTDLPDSLDNPYKNYDAKALYAFLADYKLTRPIGEKFQYSNLGFGLLGQALEHVTGKPYAELVEQRIFAPLGMTESAVGTPPGLEDRLTPGHDAERNAVSNWDFDVFAPTGAIRSSAADLGKFIAAASGATQTDLAPAFAKMLERTRPTDSPGGKIGLGWIIAQGGDDAIIWHNGQTNGYRSFTGYDPASKNAVVVLSNVSGNFGIEDIGMHILDPSLPMAQIPAPRVAVEIDPALLQNYAGTYVLGPEFTMEITTEDNKLFAQLTGQDPFEVFPESDTEFFYKVVDAQLTFETGPDGAATGLVLHQNGLDIPGSKR
ncbi:serine hydrolase [Devosia sp. 2618]|uniref:serine hydrolase n=1 Tax=Devosia sp. 2618 TaxID=3156454 RepID=UPI003399A41C